MFRSLAYLVLFINLPHAFVAHGQLLPGSPTTTWSPLVVSGPSDPFSDSQSGRNDVEIIGDGDPHHAVYRTFFEGTEANSFLDAELGFRFRMSGTQGNSSDFGGYAWAGMDVSGDGAMDFFVGINGSGNSVDVTINAAGDGLNISPSTTTIERNALWSTPATAQNYRWEPVTPGPLGNDPLAATDDLDGNGRVDHFLTFIVPFVELVTVVETIVPGFGPTSAVGFIAGTATQGNSLNADLNGVDGSINSAQTWQELGAITNPAAIPEPSTFAALFGLLALGLVRFARRRRPFRGIGFR